MLDANAGGGVKSCGTLPQLSCLIFSHRCSMFVVSGQNWLLFTEPAPNLLSCLFTSCLQHVQSCEHDSSGHSALLLETFNLFLKCFGCRLVCIFGGFLLVRLDKWWMSELASDCFLIRVQSFLQLPLTKPVVTKNISSSEAKIKKKDMRPHLDHPPAEFFHCGRNEKHGTFILKCC